MRATDGSGLSSAQDGLIGFVLCSGFVPEIPCARRPRSERRGGEPPMVDEIKMVLALGVPLALGIYLISLLRNDRGSKKRKAK